MHGITKLDKSILQKEFGVDSELLIDHAYGREYCTIEEVHHYKRKSTSLTSGQVLFEDYNYEDTRLCEQVVRKISLCDSDDFLYECMTNPIGLDKEFEDDHKVANSDALKVYDLCLY
jgi:hypothetical protein